MAQKLGGGIMLTITDALIITLITLTVFATLVVLLGKYMLLVPPTIVQILTRGGYHTRVLLVRCRSVVPQGLETFLVCAIYPKINCLTLELHLLQPIHVQTRGNL